MKVPEIARKYAILQASCPDDDTLEEVYKQHCSRAYLTINTFAPDECKTIVDIGGGLAGASMLLAFGKGSTLYVVDGDDEHGIPEHRCQDKPFNSFIATRAFQRANKMPMRKLVCLPLTLDGLPANVDFVVSFASWGFHYRVDRYLAIADRMQPGAKLVLDLRTDQRGEADKKTLSAYFSHIKDVPMSKKMNRSYYVRNETPFYSQG